MKTNVIYFNFFTVKAFVTNDCEKNHSFIVFVNVTV